MHLLLTPQEEQSLGKALQMLGRYYVQFFNHRYRRTGTLREGRYKATLIDTEAYLLTCMCYIELNPVRAGMVVHPSEYPWSSYGYNTLGQADNLVIPYPEYRRLGETDEERRGAYQSYSGTRFLKRALMQSERQQTKLGHWEMTDSSEIFKRN